MQTIETNSVFNNAGFQIAAKTRITIMRIPMLMRMMIVASMNQWKKHTFIRWLSTRMQCLD